MTCGLWHLILLHLQAVQNEDSKRKFNLWFSLIFLELFVQYIDIHIILNTYNIFDNFYLAGEVSGGHQNGMNYQRLEEECWQSEPNLASEIREVRPLGSMDSGFIREKKVADTEDNDEHVLYVQ